MHFCCLFITRTTARQLKNIEFLSCSDNIYTTKFFFCSPDNSLLDEHQANKNKILFSRSFE